MQARHGPTEFSPKYKLFIVICGIVCVWNSNLGSSISSGTLDAIANHFSIGSNKNLLVSLNSLYLVGYTFGPLVFGPLSEYQGRRPVLIGTYIGYILFTIASALSPTYDCLLGFRLLSGIVASAPNAVVGGMYADIYDKPSQRGAAIACFMCAASTAPPIGPLISGFAQSVSWNLSFWVAVALAGAGLPLVILLPETYVPVLTKKNRIGGDGEQQQAQVEQSNPSSATSVSGEIKNIFTRPFTMMFGEPLVFFTSTYLALVYAILYLFFQAYPIIFKGVFDMSPRGIGIAFLPVSAGSFLAIGISCWYDRAFAKAKLQEATWTLKHEHQRLPLACIGGPMIVTSLFWLGWTSYRSFSPVAPMFSGVLFGTGYLLIFIAMLNYLTDAYRQSSAPALAAASTTRSLAAACLPFAATPMYANLGVQWACSLLGFLALLMTPISFVFVGYGHILQAKSPLCQKIREQ